MTSTHPWFSTGTTAIHHHSLAEGFGQVDHADLLNVLTDQHHALLHAAAHGNAGVDFYSPNHATDLANVTADQHHAQSHFLRHVFGGADPTTIFSPTAITTRYYTGSYGGAMTNAVGIDQDAECMPILVAVSTTFTRIACSIQAAGAGGTPVLRLGIYADDGTGVPGALVIDAGTIDATSTTAQEITFGSAQTLTPGLYWLCAVAQGATITQPTLRMQAGTNANQIARVQALGNITASSGAVSKTGIAGALPNPLGAITGFIANSPRIFLRAQ